MNTATDQQVASETNRLLRELDIAIDQSSLVREIVSKCEHLHNIERITGPSPRTRSLREEIVRMQDRFRVSRSRPTALSSL